MEALISIEGVYKKYGQEEVLKGVDLEIFRGETILIFGGSGVGKSVLLRLINGLEKPDKGKIRIKGQEITRLNEYELAPVRKKIGFLFQGSALFDSMTVEENVSLPLLEHSKLSPSARKKMVKLLLELVELDYEADRWKRPSELSGGMQRRVSLARTLILNPEIVLYDEPTTGLDPVKADNICRLIKRFQYKQGITSVVVTHDMVAAEKIADYMAMLYNGSIIISGTSDDVQQSQNPVVQQFIRGDSQFPVTK
ncbi:ABC transporter ATP-binding protein [candidate division CSSED10-310 bacterium]|uniref:ABC transporter ATP-binding protein n=1 Tax=candidate division CSSED10-310 bacterium TaxID=2855610 RepID=A0ABV6YZY8_UNCC1